MPVEATASRNHVKLSWTDIEIDEDDSEAHLEEADAKRKEFPRSRSSS